MGNKLKVIAERIDELAKESAQFNFVLLKQAQTAVPDRSRLETQSRVEESHIVGRAQDQEKVVNLLIQHNHCNENVEVVSVFGMGGLGKTCLAQLVFNDHEIQNYFHPRLWVCVSDDFNVANIAKSIITVASGKECSTTNMELLQKTLQVALEGKRYLLVLDDVWNQDAEKWDNLYTLLNCGSEGSKILVTTRSERVSTIMRASSTYPLQCLSEEHSWDLFRQRAFSSTPKEEPNLVEIGREIVRKCGGLPLAVKALGSLMLSMSPEEWLLIKNRDLRDIEVGRDGILPVLRLSYNHLPSHMKQCFAFCAIFPKDFVMEKEKLIQLWMANGFIPSEESMELDVGNEVFRQLVWLSFFQNVEKVYKDDSLAAYHPPYEEVLLKIQSIPDGNFLHRNKMTCKMHDLMHDLAESILQSDFYTMYGLQPPPEEVRREILHFAVYDDAPFSRIHAAISCSPKLRTFLLLDKLPSLPIKDSDALKCKYLRVLDLHYYSISRLPFSLSDSKHLRYLDLSYTFIETLPEVIVTLINLQTLILIACSSLCNLPNGLSNLRKLKHLYLDGCQELLLMPEGMGQMKNLRVLTKYIIGSSNSGRGIGELKNLNLGGQLALYGLENVGDGNEAKNMNLSSKQNIRSLVLSWGVLEFADYDYPYDSPPNVVNPQFVLEALEPPSSLEELTVGNYGGRQFPRWMSDPVLLQNLADVKLFGCRRCHYLPLLVNLPFLRVLFLKKISRARHIYRSDDVKGGQVFPSLRALVLHEMEDLEEICGREDRDEAVQPLFPCLAVLLISKCPRLIVMPRSPSLKVLQIGRACNRILLESASGLSSFTSLEVDLRGAEEGSSHSHSRRDTNPLIRLQEKGFFKHLKSLEELTIKGADELTSLLENEEETRDFGDSLQRLYIEQCDRIFSPQLSSKYLGMWKKLNCLKVLDVSSCHALIYWPEEEFRALNSLKELGITSCKNLIGPRNLESSSSPSSSSSAEVGPRNLEDLCIQCCEGLTKFPKIPSKLRTIHISYCHSLQSLKIQTPESQAALRSLTVYCCSNFTSLSGLGALTALEELTLSMCPQLMQFPEEMQSLTALRSLAVYKCSNLTSFPHGLQQRLPSLQALLINESPVLEKKCKKGGEYWHLIRGIPDLSIKHSDPRIRTTCFF